MPDIRYRFELPNGELAQFDLALDEHTALLHRRPLTDPPKWTQLSFHQCSNCPLNDRDDPLCPVAHSLADVVPKFEHLVSYQELTVVIETEERTVTAKVDVQAALSSMMGLIMATSGCPHTSFFRPLARFHLPLANEQETIHRVANNWLLAQHLRRSEGHATDDTFDGLLGIYGQLQIVNAAMTKRLRAAGRTDSTLNAVVLLDLFSMIVPAAVDDSLADIKALFATFLQGPAFEPPVDQ
ncbi:MAG: hypothetical protein AB8G16_16285 [Gammaproteobacteria bacterium]